MPKSSAFTQIKAGVLEITAAIPAGHVTTYGAIGQHMNVMARHVAYILAALTVEERDHLPWHRVVADGGAIASGTLNARHRTQIEKLKQEGIAFTAKKGVARFEEVFCPPDSLVSWDYRNKCYLADSPQDKMDHGKSP